MNNNRNKSIEKILGETKISGDGQFIDFNFLTNYYRKRLGEQLSQPMEWREKTTKSLKRETFGMSVPTQEPIEEYRRLKSNMLATSVREHLKSVLLIGILPQEGCSTILFNLARSIVATGPEKILVIDANLRHPSLHKFFNLEQDIGLVEVLERKAGLTRALKETKFPNLYLLTAGRKHRNPCWIFESKQLRELVKILELEFDHLLFDCAPLNTSVDGFHLSRLVNGVILVIQAHRTRREIAQQAQKDLLRNEANILGVVLNRRKYVIPDWLYKRV